MTGKPASTPPRVFKAVVVRSIALREVDFASKWLAGIAEADRILADCKSDPGLERAIGRLTLGPYIDFSFAALEFLRRALNCGHAFPVNQIDHDLFEAFPLLSGAGFFVREAACYRAALPSTLTTDIIASSVVRLADTNDDEGDLHPDWLLTEANAFCCGKCVSIGWSLRSTKRGKRRQNKLFIAP